MRRGGILLESTLEKITEIKDRLLHEDKYRSISKRYYAGYHNMEILLSELTQKQQDMLFDYLLAEGELQSAMMAIALRDEP